MVRPLIKTSLGSSWYLTFWLTVDALSIARTQAALALSASYYQDETVSKLLLERERLAMEAEDLRSFAKPLLTNWQTRHYVLRAALFDLSIGYADRAEQILKRELGELSDNEENDEDLQEYFESE